MDQKYSYNLAKREHQKILSEVFTLTAFFRYLVGYNFAKEIIEFLCVKAEITTDDLQKRWNGFDKIFGDEEYGNLISALSFATAIEAHELLMDKVIFSQAKDAVILEIASGFSGRGILALNEKDINETQYIETDRLDVIELKKDFYRKMEAQNIKAPLLSDLNILEENDWGNILKLIKILVLDQKIKRLIIPVQGLLIYLDHTAQNMFFKNIKKLSKEVKILGIESVQLISIDVPTYQNFGDWLEHEGFSRNDHLTVIENVDIDMLKSFHNTEIDFFTYNNIDISQIKKHYYSDDIIKKLGASKLPKYKEIEGLEEKIEKFLKQKIMYVWELEL